LATSTRLGVGSPRWLPQAVPAVLFLLAVLLVPVAPSRSTDTLYRVDTPEFSVVDGFDCAVRDVLATCTVPVAGRPLTVEFEARSHFGTCAATYDGRPLSCSRVGQYGPASPWVQVGSLGVSASPAPWWRDALDLWWERLLPLVALALALVAALAAFLLYRGPRLEDDHRLRRTVITGLSCWGLAIAGNLLVTGRDAVNVGPTTLFVTVALVLPVAMVAGWQHIAAGPTSGRLRERFGQAAVAFLSTAALAAVQLLSLGLAAGLAD
jgi:hypothetical protein